MPTQTAAKFAIEVHVPRHPAAVSAVRVLAATPGTFAQWTGRRYLDGVEWHGPVLHKDRRPYTGARVCPCVLCQEFVAPSCRPGSVAIKGPRT